MKAKTVKPKRRPSPRAAAEPRRSRGRAAPREAPRPKRRSRSAGRGSAAPRKRAAEEAAEMSDDDDVEDDDDFEDDDDDSKTTTSDDDRTRSAPRATASPVRAPRPSIEHVARHLVDDPDGVFVDATERSDNVAILIHTSPGDLGRIIGKRGRVIQALRQVGRAAGCDRGRAGHRRGRGVAPTPRT